jgi:GrpB-like predicted nucleotidyltransferase (UPF0157 family)
MIGLERGVVRLEPYSEEWKQLFEQEKAILLAVLEDDIVDGHILDIQHVGSTSIPGMPAKPIIDIAIAVQDFEEARRCVPKLESLGYEYRGENGIPRRHYFNKGDPRTHHLHMNEISSADWRNMLAFRDYLIAHPQAAQEYASLKLRLAQQYPQDRMAYLDAKAPFITRILKLALG